MKAPRGKGGIAPTHSDLGTRLESGQRHGPYALNPQEGTPGTHWIGGCVGLRACLDTEAVPVIL
jgi:hypothetical protein